MLHREGTGGGAVLLNMIHGNHYQSGGLDEFSPGRVWGPWLWYLVGFSNPSEDGFDLTKAERWISH
jgi:hypothetical protein